MMKKWIALMCCIVSAGLGAAEIGDKAPHWELSRFLEGNRIRLEDMIGKKHVVLHFWMTPCRPCDNVVPILKAAAEKYGSNFQFLAVGEDDAQTILKYRFLKDFGFPVAADDMAKTSNAYLRKHDQLPSDVVISPEGVILWIGPSVDLPRVLHEIDTGKYDFAAEKDLSDFNQKMAALMKEKDYKNAVKTVDERLKRFPDYVQLIVGNAGIIGQNMNDYKKAIAVIDEALERFPKEFLLYSTKLKLIYASGGNVDGKRLYDVYCVIARNFRDKPMVLVSLAENVMKQPVGTYHLMSVYELTKAALAEKNFRNPREHGRALATMAKCYYLTGLVDRAVEFQKQANEFLRNTKDAKQARADLNYYESALSCGTTILQLEQGEKK